MVYMISSIWCFGEITSHVEGIIGHTDTARARLYNVFLKTVNLILSDFFDVFVMIANVIILMLHGSCLDVKNIILFHLILIYFSNYSFSTVYIYLSVASVRHWHFVIGTQMWKT